MVEHLKVKLKYSRFRFLQNNDNISDEDLSVDLDQPFLLCMANKGKDTNGSQFFM